MNSTSQGTPYRQRIEAPLQAAVTDIASLRTRLWKQGYRPVPVYSADAVVDGAGKRPRGNGWQQAARRDPPLAVVERTEAIAANTGILCDGLRGFDLDIDETATVDAVHKTIVARCGFTIARTRANSARTLLLYRASEGTPGKRILAGERGKVEVLGCGQQFVAYGLHPSGAELRWLPEGPREWPLLSLPSVPEGRIDELFAELAPAIGHVPPAPVRSAARSGAYVPPARAFAGVVRRIAGASEGDRNAIAYWGACRAGELVAKGEIDSATAEEIIVVAATRAGLSPIEARNTARSGIRMGAANG